MTVSIVRFSITTLLTLAFTFSNAFAGDPKHLCDQALKQDKPTVEYVRSMCLSAARGLEQEKQFDQASWYFLIAGKHEKNIRVIQPVVSSFFAYSNLANSYLLSGEEDKARQLYKKFLSLSPVPAVFDVMQGDFTTLEKVFPEQQAAIERGQAIWDGLYQPLLPINELYPQYEAAVSGNKQLEAAQIMQRIAEIQTEHQSPLNQDRADSLLNSGMLFAQVGEFAQAKIMLEEAAESLKDIPEMKTEWLTAYNWLAGIHQHQEQMDEAERYFLKSAAIIEATSPQDARQLVSVYTQLASLHGIQKPQFSIRYYEKLLGLFEQQGMSESIEITGYYVSLGQLYSHISDDEKALTINRKNLEIRKQAHGEAHYALSEVYNSIGMNHASLGQYEQAIRSYQQALALREKELDAARQQGQEQTRLVGQFVAQSYNNLASAYSDQLDFDAAEKAYLQAIPLYEEVLGKDHPETVLAYNNLALMYKKGARYDDAEVYYRKALQVREKVFGTEHADTAVSYNDLALLHYKMGQYAKARELLEKAVEVRVKVLGKDNVDTANSYSNLAQVYQYLGDYAQALNYQEKSLAISHRLFGEQHKFTATNLNNLGGIYHGMGQYESGRKFYNEAMVIRQQLDGEEGLSVANSHNNLGTLALDSGDYATAITHYKQYLTLTRNKLGEEHPTTAEAYNNLGAVYHFLGNHSQALEHHEIALNIRQVALGEDHPDTAISYNNIGIAYEELGEVGKTLDYYQKSLAITKQHLGPEHPALATNYNNLALLYEKMEQPDDALFWAQQALKLRQDTLGEAHPDTAVSYSGLAVAYQHLGQYHKALENHKKALETQEELLGASHIDTINSYSNLGTVYSLLGDTENYYQYATKSFALFQKNRERVFTALDAREKDKYLKGNNFRVGLLLNAASDRLAAIQDKDKSIADRVLQDTANEWLNYKGSLFDAENAILLLASGRKDAAVQDKLEKLLAAKRKLAKLYQSLPKRRERKQWQQNIVATEATILQLNKVLAESVAAFRHNQRRISSTDIAQHLGNTELYLDFARTDLFYYLFSIDSDNQIRLIRFNKQAKEQIDTFIASFRRDVDTLVNSDSLSAPEMAALTLSSQESLGKLYKLIIEQPLQELLRDKSSLIISADGALRLLPLEALYNQAGKRYFTEEKTIRYITSGRELARLYQQPEQIKSVALDNAEARDTEKLTTDKTVVFANPDFDLDLAKVAKRDVSAQRPASRAGIIRSLFKMRFSPLAGTQAEANAIKATLEQETLQEYRRADATEASLLATTRPQRLHIATHGFFLNDNSIPNPMLKSGLALAGANASAIRGRSDGIVTALKLSGMQLQNTELVVLSACETGVVDPESTEAVSGLSKAFIQAGAQNIVMSLWSVADQETMELMQGFYQQLSTQENQNYVSALRSSQLEMIRQHKHPYYWAAFILNGGN